MTDNDSYTAAYTYSADGLRLRAQESNNPHTDRWFLYDGVRPTAEGTLSGNTFTSTAEYVWEGDSYYDPLVSASIGGEDRFYLFDGLGSTRQLLDGDQAVTDSYSYEAFGNVLSDGGPTPNPYRYVGSFGYYACGDGHLLHLGARYYLREVGRFMGREHGSAHANGYAYAGMNPVGYVDATGRDRMPSPLPVLIGGPPFWLPPYPPVVGPVQPRPGPIAPLPEDPVSCVLRVKREESNEHKRVNDKWQHCNVSCEISRQCIGGVNTGAAAGLGKELQDVFGPGDASWCDLVADAKGLRASGSGNPCDKACDGYYKR